MRKPMFSCAESGAFRFAARRARFSGFMSCALVGRLFAQDCVSVFSGRVSIRSGKSLSVQVKWAYRGVTCDNCDK